MKKWSFFIFLFYLSFPLTSFSHTSQDKNVYIIHMDKDGFSPSDISISKNDVVIFENVDARDRWPASNIHPSHSIYPKFDPKKPVVLGSQWQFKFDKAGKWKFHDHLYPELTGTIAVRENEGNTNASSFLKRFFNFIKKSVGNLEKSLFIRRTAKINFEGLSLREILNNPDFLSAYLKSKGVKETIGRLIRESGGGSAFDCHQEAHTIGRIGYEISGEEVFRQCDASCHSGCYHGAMESFLNKTGTINIAKNIKRICQTFETNFGVFECLHGVGHGVLAYTNYDLPEAINECKNLGDSFSISSCYGGLFMENILTGQGLGAGKIDHQTSWVNKKDPFFPCNAIGDDSELLYQCYQMQTSWMLTIDNYDFVKVAKECLKAPKDMVSVCIKSYGRDAAGYTLRDPRKIVKICANIRDNNHRDECFIGAVNVVVDFWGHNLKSQASELCEVAGESKNACYGSLTGRLAGLFNNKADRLNICGTMEDAYKEKCYSAYNN